MKKPAILIIALLTAGLVACGASGEKNDPAAEGLSDEGIEWVKYDAGLKQAAEDGKYVMLYFWRPG